MKSIRECVDIFAQAHQLAVDGLRSAVMCVRLTGLESGCVDCHARQALCDIIVQFASESSPLVLVRREQPPAQRKRFALGATPTYELHE